MSRVHFNSLKPGLFQTARCAAGYMQAILLTCKKIANLLALLLFVFLPLTLKLCEAVVIKCMYKISVDSRLLQKLRLNWGRSEETTNTVFASLQVKNTAGRRFVPADSHYLRAMSYSAVHPVHSPQSQSTNVYVCVKWIRPDDVFSTCLASLDLTLNSKQEGGGRGHVQYLQRNPSSNSHSTERQPHRFTCTMPWTGKRLWKREQKFPNLTPSVKTQATRLFKGSASTARWWSSLRQIQTT